MRFFHAALLAALAAAPVYASGLTFTLDPSVESGQAISAGDEVLFTGTLTDTDTTNTCDSQNVNCLYLNFISFSFDQPNAPLTPDFDQFVNNVQSPLSDDSIPGLASYTGIVFGITIDPDALPGIYTGTATILGGYDDPNPPSLTNPLATVDWTVQVTPEPADFGMVVAGLGAIVLAKRRLAKRRVAS